MSIFKQSYKQTHMILGCFFVEIKMLTTVRRWHLHDLLTSDPRLCVGGNLGFLHPVRISQAFLSAQESGSAADTTLSFALHVSLCLSFESLRTSVIILLIFCLSSSVNHFCQFVHLSGLWHSRRFNCITYHSQRSGFGWFLRVHLCSWADLHCWILLVFFLCGDVKSNVVTGKSSFRLAQMVRHTYWHK